MTESSEKSATPIQQFFSGQNILIAGGTGFLGKILIEKLLRSCSDLSTIYVLLRPKKGQDAHQRLGKLIEDPVFGRLKEESPKFFHKLVAVSGDCESLGIGLSSADRDLLSQKISVVFNLAANINFNAKIQDAVAINVRGPREMLDLCHQMKNLKVVIHVSTAYSNCTRIDIDEKFYKPTIPGDKIIELVQILDDKTLTGMTKTLLGKFPNTYSYTKQIGEQIVQQYGQDLPIGIYRPAVVISTYKEPMVGWVDNVSGCIGYVVSAGAGLLTIMRTDRDCLVDSVPVDYAANALIALAWDLANNQKRSADPPIYNHVSSSKSSLTMAEFFNTTIETLEKYPSVKSIWHPTLTMVKDPFLFFILSMIFHTLPALFFDLYLFLTFQKPKMLQATQKIHKYIDVISHFTTREWKFTDNNTTKLWEKLTDDDKEIFYFSMDNFDWKDCLQKCVLGVRLYMYKEDPSTVAVARKRMARFRTLAHIMKLIAIVGFAWALYEFLVFISTSQISRNRYASD